MDFQVPARVEISTSALEELLNNSAGRAEPVSVNARISLREEAVPILESCNHRPRVDVIKKGVEYPIPIGIIDQKATIRRHAIYATMSRLRKGGCMCTDKDGCIGLLRSASQLNVHGEEELTSSLFR